MNELRALFSKGNSAGRQDILAADYGQDARRGVHAHLRTQNSERSWSCHQAKLLLLLSVRILQLTSVVVMMPISAPRATM
jgi:hypothetical protein